MNCDIVHRPNLDGPGSIFTLILPLSGPEADPAHQADARSQ